MENTFPSSFLWGTATAAHQAPRVGSGQLLPLHYITRARVLFVIS